MGAREPPLIVSFLNLLLTPLDSSVALAPSAKIFWKKQSSPRVETSVANSRFLLNKNEIQKKKKNPKQSTSPLVNPKDDEDRFGT